MRPFLAPGWRSASVLLCTALTLAACGGGGGDSGNGGSTADNAPPTASIVFPPTDALFTAGTLTLRGTASDDGDVVSVSVNGVPAISDDGFATWTATVTLTSGVNRLGVRVEDGAGRVTSNADEVAITRIETPLGNPTGIKIDTGNNRAILLDSSYDALFEMDLTTGNRRVLSSALRGDGPTFQTPLNLDIDAAGTTAYVADYALHAVFAVDLASGDRRIVSSSEVGIGEALTFIRDVALDEANNRLFTATYNSESEWFLIEIDLETGNRTVRYLGDINVWDLMAYPYAIEWDPVLQEVVLGGYYGQLAWLDPAASWIRYGNYAVEHGLNEGSIIDIALVPGTEDAYVLSNLGGIWRAGRYSTPSRVQVSSNESSPGPAFASPNALAVHGDRLLVADPSAEAILTVDTATGERANFVTADNAATGGGVDVVALSQTAFSPANDTAFVHDYVARKIIGIDMNTGQRSLVANVTPFERFVVDEASDRLLTIAGDGTSVYEIPIAGGEPKLLYENPATVGSTAGIHGLMLDASRNRLIFQANTTDELRVLRLDDLAEEVLSGGGIGSGDPLERSQALALDEQRSRILSATYTPPTLRAVDLATGDRSVLISAAGNTVFSSVPDMVVDGDDAWLLDAGANRVIHMNLASGAHQIVAGNGSGGKALFGLAYGLHIDSASQIGWTADAGIDALLVFDLTSGDYVIVSR